MDRRQIVRTTALTLSVAFPIGFVAYADHVRQSTGINWLWALGALVALSVVIATFVLPRGADPVAAIVGGAREVALRTARSSARS